MSFLKRRGGKASEIGQVKYGAILSYLLIILNTLYGVVVTPFIIKSLGMSQYGVYKTIAALSSSLMVVDLGIGGTVQRYVAKYRAEKQEDKIPNFMAMSLLITIVLNMLILAICSAVYFGIEPAYSGSFTSEQIILAKRLFAVLTVSMLLNVLEHVLGGLVSGYNRFIYGNGRSLCMLLLRIVLLFALLSQFSSALVITGINVSVSLINILLQVIYIKKNLKIKIKFACWDKALLREAGKYTALMFITSVATQIFSNLDNILIGSMCGPDFVTVYSVGLLFFGMFQNLSMGVSGVMLPTVTNTLSQENSDQKLIKIITQAGKIQFILLGAALVGFACIGKDFINVWMGTGYEDVYVITLILLVPSIFELCVNVCLSVLRAQNRLGFRTFTVIMSALFNAVMTIVLLRVWNYIGAAIATACSYIICSLLAMNIYYIRVIKLPMWKIYGGILKRTVPCLVVAGICLFVFSRFVYGSWLAILANVAIFCLIYGAMLWLIGLNKEEKQRIPIVGKFIK